MSKTLEQILTPLVKQLIPMIDRLPEVLVFWPNEVSANQRTPRRQHVRPHPTYKDISLTVILRNGLAVEVRPTGGIDEHVFTCFLLEIMIGHRRARPIFETGWRRGHDLGIWFAHWDLRFTHWDPNFAPQTPWGTSPVASLLTKEQVIRYIVRNANAGWSEHGGHSGEHDEDWLDLPGFEQLKAVVERVRYERERRAEDARLLAEAEREAERESPVVIRRKKFEW